MTKLNFKITLLACISLVLVLTACSASAEYDIRGSWSYTMIASDGNTNDTGTITFSGSPTRGTYIELNIYKVEYRGEYKVDGSSVTLTGDETWQGTISDANNMSGVWQHDDGLTGKWTAIRKTP